MKQCRRMAVLVFLVLIPISTYPLLSPNRAIAEEVGGDGPLLRNA